MIKMQHLVEESNTFGTGPLLAKPEVFAKKRINRKTESLRPLDPDNAPDEMWTC